MSGALDSLDTGTAPAGVSFTDILGRIVDYTAAYKVATLPKADQTPTAPTSPVQVLRPNDAIPLTWVVVGGVAIVALLLLRRG